MMRLPLAMLIVLALGCSSRSSTTGSNGAGKASIDTHGASTYWKPVFRGTDGQELRPFDEPHVKAVALVFVLQDCPIANSYMPELNRQYERFEPRGVRMIVVESDPKITVAEAHKHADDFQIALPVVVDADHRWVKFATAKRTPEAVVFSPGGDILYRGRIDDQYVGLGKRRMQVTKHDLQDALEAILADRPVANPVTEAIGCYIPEVPVESK